MKLKSGKNTINMEIEVQNHFTDVDIDPVEVLDELDPADIEDYLTERQSGFHEVLNHWDYAKLADSYYHGNFDLKLFLKELKMNDLASILESKKFCRPY